MIRTGTSCGHDPSPPSATDPPSIHLFLCPPPPLIAPLVLGKGTPYPGHTLPDPRDRSTGGKLIPGAASFRWIQEG